MRIIDYMDVAKHLLEINSDNELAKRIDLTRGQVSAIRNGYRSMPLHAAMKIAEIVEVEPIKIICEMEIEREKNPARREYWRNLLQNLDE